MHPEAYSGLARMLENSGIMVQAPCRVLDLGGREIDGSVRLAHDVAQHWPANWYRFDLVVCTEILEHVQQWRQILRTASQDLEPSGPEALLLTCASTDRYPHGASGGPKPLPKEWHTNVAADALHRELEPLFRTVSVPYTPHPGDAYTWARGVRR